MITMVKNPIIEIKSLRDNSNFSEYQVRVSLSNHWPVDFTSEIRYAKPYGQ
jgi:hypothetical protein